MRALISALLLLSVSTGLAEENAKGPNAEAAALPKDITFAEIKWLQPGTFDWKTIGELKDWVDYPPFLATSSRSRSIYDHERPEDVIPNVEVTSDGLVMIAAQLSMNGRWPEQPIIDQSLAKMSKKGWIPFDLMEVTTAAPYVLFVKQFKQGDKVVMNEFPFVSYYLIRCDAKHLTTIRELIGKPIKAIPNPLIASRQQQQPASSAPPPERINWKMVPQMTPAIAKPGEWGMAALRFEIPGAQPPWLELSAANRFENVPAVLKGSQICPVPMMLRTPPLPAGSGTPPGSPAGPPGWLAETAGLVVIAVIIPQHPKPIIEQYFTPELTRFNKLGWEPLGDMVWKQTPAVAINCKIMFRWHQAAEKLSLTSDHLPSYFVLQCPDATLTELKASKLKGVAVPSVAAKPADSTKPASNPAPLPMTPANSKPAAVAVVAKPSPPMAMKPTAPAPARGIPNPGNDERPSVSVVEHPQIPSATKARARQLSAATSRFGLASNHAGAVTTPLLNREIVRQALLLTVREELGLSTHDASLREFRTGNAPTKMPLDVLVECDDRPEYGSFTVTIFRDTTSGSQILWSRQGAVKPTMLGLEGEYGIRRPGSVTDWLVSYGEEWSRTEFRDVLLKDGLKPKVRTTKASPLDKSLLKRFERIDEYSQFLVLRDLHEIISTSGETPERLEYLARTYANLGALTHRLMSAHSQVFFARALLYAERLRTRSPELPQAWWTRAYVNGLAGRHLPAVADLDEAERLTQEGLGKGGTRVMPAWSKVIRATCEYKLKDLDECVRLDPSTAPLANYLRMILLTYEGAQSLRVQAAQQVLEGNPDTLQAYEICSQKSPMGIQREFAERGLTAQSTALIKALKDETGFSTAFKKLLRSRTLEQQASVAVQQQLVEQLNSAGDAASDTSEPSWHCLGSLLEEMQFLQIQRICQTCKNMLGLPVEQALDELRPLVRNHPHYALLDGMCDVKSLDSAKLTDLIANQDLTDAGSAHEPLVAWLDDVREHQQYKAVWKLTESRQAVTWLEFAPRASLVWTGYHNNRGTLELKNVAPASPVAAASILYFENPSSEVIAELERQFGDNFTVLSAIVDHYRSRKQPADALRYAERRVGAAPAEPLAYRQLAAIALEVNDREKWKATLDKFLTIEDYGLEDDRARVDIAEWLMKEKRYTEARPYAYEAVQCHSAWALMCGFQCSRALDDWKMAEHCLGGLATRYRPELALDWFLVCREIGHPNAGQAVSAAKREIESRFEKTPFKFGPPLIAFHYLSGRKHDAVTFGSKFSAKVRHPYPYMMTILVADELDQANVRDQLLTDLDGLTTKIAPVLKPGAANSWYKPLIACFRKFLAGGPRAQFDEAEYDKIVQATGVDERHLLHLWTGWFLFNHKSDALGTKYLQLAATSTHSDTSRSLARAILTGHGIKPGKIREKED